MIVVADASPLNYLIQLECDRLLPLLYERVLVPHSVISELRHRKAPRPVALWAASLPSWVEVRIVEDQIGSAVKGLDAGERDAIQLAEAIKGSVLLIDEVIGRDEAAKRGIQTTGTLGILLAASQAGILDGEDAFSRLLTSTTFRASSHVRAEFAARFAGLRKTAKKDSIE